MKLLSKHKKSRGYTLVETLIASAVIMLAVGAASSLSLAMVTQEEMSERTVRASNYLHNASNLYRLGFDLTEILNLLPAEPVVSNLTLTPKTVNVAGLGNVTMAEMTVTFNPSASSSNATGGWTGGSSSTSRTHTIEVLRTSL